MSEPLQQILGTAHTPLHRHLWRTLVLAVPIIVARTAVIAMFVVDTVMVGWSGERELAAFALGSAPLLTAMMVCIGALQACAVLVAQGQGRGEAAVVGAVLRASLVHALLLGALVLVLSAYAENLFLLTGQDPGLAAAAADVSFLFGLAMPLFLVFVTVNLFLEAIGRPRAGMVVLLVLNAVNVVLNGILALGWGGLVVPMGAEGAMAGSSALRCVAAVVLGGYAALVVRRHPEWHLSGVGAVRVWAGDLLRFGGAEGRALRRLGLPMGIAQGIESAAFSTMVFFAGLLGAAHLAAYQAVMSLVTLAYMMAVGTAGATAIRVGRAVGRGRPEEVLAAGWTGIAVSMLLPLPIAAAFLAVPDDIVGLVVSDGEVIAFAAAAMAVAAVMLPFDAAMGVSLGALRGLGDVWMPTLLQIAAFWILAVPAGWLLSVHAGLGAAGLVGGLLVGVVISLVLLAARFPLVARPTNPVYGFAT